LLVASVSEPRETSMIYLCGATTAPFIHPPNVFGFGGFPLARVFKIGKRSQPECARPRAQQLPSAKNAWNFGKTCRWRTWLWLRTATLRILKTRL
jgi:hypothetical protein